MVAHSAMHMPAAEILLDGDSTLRANMGIRFAKPSLKHLVADLITSFSFVPRHVAAEADISLTLLASHFLGRFCWGHDDVFTAWIGAELLQLVKHHRMISLELKLLLV